MRDELRFYVLHIVNSPVLFFATFFILRACLWVTIETFWHERPVPYRRVTPIDFSLELLHVFLVVPIAVVMWDFASELVRLPPILQHTPLSFRILVWVVLGDCGYYWMHRLMHLPSFWRVHKWHHYPTYMYWLAGCRATIQHQFLVGLPFVLMSQLLEPAPWWVFTVLAAWSYLVSDWMHLNVSWGSRWAEWVFVTPRFHHIHHSANPDHYDQNLGNFFAIWDRLFGTYVDPDKVRPAEITFGIGERPGAVRLIAGL